MKKMLTLLVFLTISAFAQECQQSYEITTSATAGPIIDNRNRGCQLWNFVYWLEGFTAITVRLEYSIDQQTWTATTLSLTDTPVGKGNVRLYAPYFRVYVVSATGSGRIKYIVGGYKGNYGLTDVVAGGTGGGGGGYATVENDAVALTQRDTLNLQSSDEIDVVCGDATTKTNCQFVVNTGVVQLLANSQSGAPLKCVSSTGNDSYTCNLLPTLTGYTDGMVVQLRADTANVGASSLTIDGQATVAIKKCDGTSDPADGDVAIGRYIPLTFRDAATDYFQLPCNPQTVSGGGGFTNPMTTQGDLITGGASGAAGRLAVGTNGQGLVSDGTNPTWSDVIKPFSNWFWLIDNFNVKRNQSDGFGQLGWANEGQGTETIESAFTSTGGFPDVKMQTGSTSGDSAILNMHQSSSGRMAFALGSTSPFTGGWEARWKVYTDSAVTNRIMAFGFRSANSDTEYRVNSAVYVRFDTANPSCGSGSGSGTTWVLEKYTGSASTCADTGVTVSANTEYVIKLYSTTLGTVNAQVSTNGGAFSSAVNVTSLFTTQVAPYWQIETSTSAAAYMYARRWEFLGK